MARDIWPGGHVHIGADGRKTFVIRKRVGGVRYTVSTRCSTLRAAMVELERFEADPTAYAPGGPKKSEPLHLTDALAIDFLRWSSSTEGNTDKWVSAQKRYLIWWGAKLAGVDLRTCGGAPLRAALVGQAALQPRIAVIKRFCAWLVKEREMLRPEQNPTATMTVPQSKPEQWKREKAIARIHYQIVRDIIEEPWRSALDVLAGTGWHLTELERFAAGGDVLDARREGEAAILLCPRAKSGEPIRTAVSAAVREAAERVRARGQVRGDSLFAAVHDACKRERLEPFNPGSFRHSVATWAIEAGADPASVAAFLGHKSATTTRKFYATHAAPKKIPTLL